MFFNSKKMIDYLDNEDAAVNQPQPSEYRDSLIVYNDNRQVVDICSGRYYIAAADLEDFVGGALQAHFCKQYRCILTVGRVKFAATYDKAGTILFDWCFGGKQYSRLISYDYSDCGGSCFIDDNGRPAWALYTDFTSLKCATETNCRRLAK